MILIEEKMHVFTHYLISKERSWGKEIVSDAKARRKELIDQSEKLIHDEKRAIEERSYRQIYRDKNKIIAEGKNKAKNLELAQKKLMLKEFNELILKYANDNVKGEMYENYLSRCMEKVDSTFKDSQKLVITVNLEDIDLIKDLAKEKLGRYEINYKINSKNSFIRGMIVEDDQGRVQSDFTMNSAIKANYKLIGMTLNEFMKKQVS